MVSDKAVKLLAVARVHGPELRPAERLSINVGEQVAAEVDARRQAVELFAVANVEVCLAIGFALGHELQKATEAFRFTLDVVATDTEGHDAARERQKPV